MPEWFDKKNIFFFLSMMSDFSRKRLNLNMPLNWPIKPDPIKQIFLLEKFQKISLISMIYVTWAKKCLTEVLG